MKVKMYRTAKYQKTDILEVERIEAMPDTDEITQDDIDIADGVYMTLYKKDGSTLCVPPSFIISIEP